MTTFTAANGVTTTLEYDALGRIAHRTTAQGASDYVYVGASDWLLKETWHSAISGTTFDLVQYDYVNGAPFRIKVASTNGDLSQLNSYTTYYLQMNWHGDAMILVGTQGDASNNYNINYDPWGGSALPHANPRNYYGWNAQWGYQYFADLGMYYAHGRWWRADLGIWLTPSEEGEYRYGSGEDPINWVWQQICNRTPDSCATATKLATDLSSVDWGALFNTTGLQGDWYQWFSIWFFEQSPDIGVWSYESGEPLVTITASDFINDLKSRPHYRNAINALILK